MIIQIDIDGTIDAAPTFFSWLTAAARRDGHSIHIVSSRTTSPTNLKATAAELEDTGIVYDKLVLSPDVDDLDPARLPPGLPPAHRIYVYKLIVAEDEGADLLFDDCSITADLFRKHLPRVRVFRPLR